jgi:hypothetical protein
MGVPVEEKVCDERHKRVNEQLDRLNDHADRIKELEESKRVQVEINNKLIEQLNTLLKWKEEQEAKPARRWEQVVNTFLQWATLAVLGLIALTK